MEPASVLKQGDSSEKVATPVTAFKQPIAAKTVEQLTQGTEGNRAPTIIDRRASYDAPVSMPKQVTYGEQSKGAESAEQNAAPTMMVSQQAASQAVTAKPVLVLEARHEVELPPGMQFTTASPRHQESSQLEKPHRRVALDQFETARNRDKPLSGAVAPMPVAVQADPPKQPDGKTHTYPRPQVSVKEVLATPVHQHPQSVGALSKPANPAERKQVAPAYFGVERSETPDLIPADRSTDQVRAVVGEPSTTSPSLTTSATVVKLPSFIAASPALSASAVVEHQPKQASNNPSIAQPLATPKPTVQATEHQALPVEVSPREVVASKTPSAQSSQQKPVSRDVRPAILSGIKPVIEVVEESASLLVAPNRALPGTITTATPHAGSDELRHAPAENRVSVPKVTASEERVKSPYRKVENPEGSLVNDHLPAPTPPAVSPAPQPMFTRTPSVVVETLRTSVTPTQTHPAKAEPRTLEATRKDELKAPIAVSVSPSSDHKAEAATQPSTPPRASGEPKAPQNPPKQVEPELMPQRVPSAVQPTAAVLRRADALPASTPASSPTSITSKLPSPQKQGIKEVAPVRSPEQPALRSQATNSEPFVQHSRLDSAPLAESASPALSDKPDTSPQVATYPQLERVSKPLGALQMTSNPRETSAEPQTHAARSEDRPRAPLPADAPPVRATAPSREQAPVTQIVNSSRSKVVQAQAVAVTAPMTVAQVQAPKVNRKTAKHKSRTVENSPSARTPVITATYRSVPRQDSPGTSDSIAGRMFREARNSFEPPNGPVVEPAKVVMEQVSKAEQSRSPALSLIVNRPAAPELAQTLAEYPASREGVGLPPSISIATPPDILASPEEVGVPNQTLAASVPVNESSETVPLRETREAKSSVEPATGRPEKAASGSPEPTSSPVVTTPVRTEQPAQEHQPFATPQPSSPVRTIDPAQFVASIRSETSLDGQKLEIILKPETLGRAIATIIREEDRLRVEFQCEHPEAKQAVQAEAASLKEALVAAGFQNVTVDVKSDGFRGASSDGGAAHRDTESGRDQSQQRSPQDDSRRRQEQPPSRPVRRGYNSFEITA